MDSINSAGLFALSALWLSFSGGPVMAQNSPTESERVSIDADANTPRQALMRDMILGGAKPTRNVRSGILDWETGAFQMRGERLKSGSRWSESVRAGSRWQRTYAAELNFWDRATSGIAVEAGARFARTLNGINGGPLLTNSTKTVERMAYVGVQISPSSSIRLIGFDNGGGPDEPIAQRVSRIANGESAAREGAAMEIGRFETGPGDALWQPHVRLRLERGRIEARSNTSATLTWKVSL